jgi:large subunit ribosomal protein L10
MKRSDKETLVATLAQRLTDSPTLYLTDFSGISVKNMTDFRSKLRESGVEYVVVKNTLASRAFAGASVEGFADVLTGPTGLVITNGDPAGAAKIIKDFQKKHSKPAVKAGLVDGKRVSAEEVDRLASLPSKEQLLSQLAGAMQAPMQAFVGVCGELLHQFVGAVEALRSQRSEGA